MKNVFIFLLLSIKICGQGTLNGKKFQALVSESCEEMIGGGCMLYEYCLISFEKDSAAISYFTKASCSPKEREKGYEQTIQEKHVWHAENDKVYINNSKKDTLTIINEEYIEGTINFKDFSILNKTFMALQDVYSFKNKLDFTSNLLKEQPSKGQLQLANRRGYFNLDSVYENALYYSHTKGDYITVYFDDADKILSIAFEEKKEKQNEICNYLTETAKFEYFASEHMCNYYNKEGINVCMCSLETRLNFSITLFYK